MSAARTFVFRYSLANIKPSVRSVDVSFVMDHLVDLGGNLCLGFGGEAANDDLIVKVIACQLAIPVVGTAAVATIVGIIALDVLRITDQKDVRDVRIVVVLLLNVSL